MINYDVETNIVTIKLENTLLGTSLGDLISAGHRLTTSGIGIINENKIVTEFELQYLFVDMDKGE